MKQFRRTALFLVIVLIMSVLSPAVTPSTVQAQGLVRLNKPNLELEIGQTFTLEVFGTTSKITWSTSDKEIATVSKSGLVTAINIGKVIITAKVNKIKYNCVLTVKKVPNPFIKKAPFTAREAIFNNVDIVYPVEWDNRFYTYTDSTTMRLISPKATYTTQIDSEIYLRVYDLETTAPDYDEAKKHLEELYTNEYVQKNLTEYYDNEYTFSVTGLQTSDAQTTLGQAFKITYNASYSSTNDSGSFADTVYLLYYDHYLIELDITDNKSYTTSNLYQIGEYILNSLQIIG